MPGLLRCRVWKAPASRHLAVTVARPRGPTRVRAVPGRGRAITSSSLPRSPRPRQTTLRSRAIAAFLPSKPRNEGIGSPGGPELLACCLLRKPISRRARDLAGPAKTKPRPTHAGADQGCAGRRGDGGWGGTRPAQVQRSISARVPGLGSISFQRPVMGAKAPLGRLSRRHPAAPPGWSGPARNRPRCRWPGFAPAGRGRGAPGF